MENNTVSFFFSRILDLFLPRRCVICGRTLYSFEKVICTVCSADIPKTYFWQQAYNEMSESFNLLIQESIQENEEAWPMPVRFVPAAAFFFYRSGSDYRQITRSLKYSYDLSSGRYFSGLFAAELEHCTFLQGVDVVVPVPLHPLRKWKRGYNQAAVIARALLPAFPARLEERLLVRKRPTRTQTRLNVEEKRKNVRNAFGVRDRVLRKLADGRPHHLLLVDDVYTTGSTLFACYEALKDAMMAGKFDFAMIRISLVTLGYAHN